MIAFLGKCVFVAFRIGLAIFVIALLILAIDTHEAYREGWISVGEFVWGALCAIGHDLWAFAGHFWDQAWENLGVLADGAVNDDGFNVARWFIGGPVYVFVAFCQSIGWWLSHGRTVEAIAYIVGAPILALLILPHLGNIGLSGGGGGGGGGKGGH